MLARAGKEWESRACRKPEYRAPGERHGSPGFLVARVASPPRVTFGYGRAQARFRSRRAAASSTSASSRASVASISSAARSASTGNAVLMRPR